MPDINCKWFFFYQPPFVCCIVTFGICILVHCYYDMFRNPVNQFMQLNLFPAVKTFVNTWTGAERHAWRNRYWRSRGQIVCRHTRRNGARLLQRTLVPPCPIWILFQIIVVHDPMVYHDLDPLYIPCKQSLVEYYRNHPVRLSVLCSHRVRAITSFPLVISGYHFT